MVPKRRSNTSANKSKSPPTKGVLPNIDPNYRLRGKRTRKAPRYKPPERFLKEIRHFQSTTHTLIPLAPFARLVREITVEVTNKTDIRYQGLALKALHEAAESYIIGLLEDSYLLALHSKRVTLMARDISLAYKIRGDGPT